jgi:hypothetical protein
LFGSAAKKGAASSKSLFSEPLASASRLANSQPKRLTMKYAILVTAAAALLASPAAYAQGSSGSTPGHEMQQKGSRHGDPGASGYAPGQEMQNKGSVKGTSGASGYAPGHATTGSSKTRTRDHNDKTKSRY